MRTSMTLLTSLPHNCVWNSGSSAVDRPAGTPTDLLAPVGHCLDSVNDGAEVHPTGAADHEKTISIRLRWLIDEFHDQ
ncbi:MAG: hypothetical protein A07HR60_01415 [uncultured archaeon A07HR60]|nr:MAG: hypothetical protein A07HR60_01415 [uncultured archaeon A07HR60]